MKIRRFNPRPSAFIQFDKPIYRPTDMVKIQIPITDNAGLPYHVNNIEIVVRDSHDFEIARFTNLEDQRSGLFEEIFEIPEDVNTGEWIISVKLNNDERSRIERKFKVARYSMPLFDIKIGEINVENGEFEVDIVGEYASGEVVNGIADVKILNFENQEIFGFTGVGEKITRKIRFEELNLDDFDSVVKLKLQVELKDLKTNLKFKKSKEFEIFKDLHEKIITIHRFPLIPGKTYYIDAQIIDIHSETPLTESNKTIELWQIIEKFTKTIAIKLSEKMLKNGVAKFEFSTSVDANKIKIETRYKELKLSEILSKNVVISDALEVEIDDVR